MGASWSTSCTFAELVPNAEYKEIIVLSPSVMIASDQIAITLADHGISASGVLTVTGFVHTTIASIVTSDQPTTTVYGTSGILILTAPSRVPTGYQRVYRIIGRSN